MGPCEWPVQLVGCTSSQEAALGQLVVTGEDGVEDTSQREAVERMAVDYLWEWTGRRYGTCPVTVQPCDPDEGGCPVRTSTYWGRGPYGSARSAASVLAAVQRGCGCRPDAKGCTCGPSGDEIPLRGPVAAVTRVRLDGAVFTKWATAGNRLIRTDGGTWPRCQDADAAVPAFEVDYQRGRAVPVGGQIAAGVLAAELALALCSDPECGLPQRIQSITRQGVTVAVVDAFEDVEKGRTGIWLIDSWVASVTKAPQGATVTTPETLARQKRG